VQFFQSHLLIGLKYDMVRIIVVFRLVFCALKLLGVGIHKFSRNLEATVKFWVAEK
jgi:hypothetical protein